MDESATALGQERCCVIWGGQVTHLQAVHLVGWVKGPLLLALLAFELAGKAPPMRVELTAGPGDREEGRRGIEYAYDGVGNTHTHRESEREEEKWSEGKGGGHARRSVGGAYH